MLSILFGIWRTARCCPVSALIRVFWHAHDWEVSPVPEGFRVYARTQNCAIQFAAHAALPRYGTQFHPEHYNETHPEGKRVLENFFKLIKG